MGRPKKENNNKDIICLNCQSIFSIPKFKNRTFCSGKCSQLYTKSKNRDWLGKRDLTNLDKYGVKSPLESKEVLNKYKRNMLDKWGCESPFGVKEIREKSSNTILERYGFEFANQNKDIALKISNSIKGIQKDRTNFINIKWDKIELFCKETDIKPLFNKEYLENNKVIEGKFKFQCNKCSSFMEVGLNNGYFPSCTCSNYRGYSLIEEEIQKFIINNYGEDVKLKVRGMITSTYELDIFIKKLNLAIEVNGIYWHSENLGKYREYHLFKTNECLKQNIQLIHIFDNEWIFKKPIIQSILLNKLGLTPNKIYARKCQIKEISSEESKEFLNQNHRQGFCPSKNRIGLYHEDKLVCLMTFGKNRFKNDGKIELLRFCNKLNTNVIGGASKLLKYYNKNINVENLDIVSFADRRFSDGKLYENLGFDFDSFTKPSYFYWKNTKILNRISCQKHKLEKLLPIFNKELSEYENMKLNKWFRVWDCGNYKFIYRSKKDLNKRS